MSSHEVVGTSDTTSQYFKKCCIKRNGSDSKAFEKNSFDYIHSIALCMFIIFWSANYSCDLWIITILIYWIWIYLLV